MSAVSKIVVGFAVLILALAVIAGFSTGPGHDIASATGSIVMTTLRWTGAGIGRLAAWWGTTGNAARAFVAALIAFVAALLFPAVRGNGWALTLTAVGSVVFGVLLWQPGLAAGLGA